MEQVASQKLGMNFGRSPSRVPILLCAQATLFFPRCLSYGRGDATRTHRAGSRFWEQGSMKFGPQFWSPPQQRGALWLLHCPLGKALLLPAAPPTSLEAGCAEAKIVGLQPDRLGCSPACHCLPRDLSFFIRKMGLSIPIPGLL